MTSPVARTTKTENSDFADFINPAIELNKKGEMYYKLFVVLGVTLMLIVV